MKNNNFKVKEKKEKRVVLEEDIIKNPILLLLKKNRKSITTGLMMILVCLFLVSIGIGFSLFRGSNDYDIKYITGSDKIESNNNPEIDDEDVEDELLGEIAREEGVVILVNSFMTPNGDIISYYTDGTSILVDSKGRIYRISTNKKGNYGIDKNGKIDVTAIKVKVTSTTSTLADGSIVTYYSDGTAKVELNNTEIFVRDSNNVKIDENNTFRKTLPSGVELTKDTIKIENGTAKVFSDGTILITRGKEEMFIINKNAVNNIGENYIDYNRENTFSVISEKTYSDGNTIRHFSNGSATITDKKGNTIYVKNSGDLVLKHKKLYEIIPNDKANSMKTVRCSDGSSVIYYDNGAAIIISPTNDRKYVEDSDDIVYSGNKISSEFTSSKLISVMLTEDGKKAYSFENGKTQIINKDNSSYIVNTDTLNLKPIPEDNKDETKPEDSEDKDKDKEEEKDEGTTPKPIDPGAGIDITEAEHKYDDPFSVQSTTFIIQNNNNKSRVLRIVLEEINDYDRFNTSRLHPQYVKFQATVGDDYVPASVLNANTWVDANEITNFVLYDGIIPPKTSLNVAIALYVDYSLLDNSHQNKGFIGTIKVYVDDMLG